MFEVAELGHKISKLEYKKQEPIIRTSLLEVQAKLKQADFPVIVIVSGVDGGGKGHVINILNEWLDPRYLRTHAFGTPTQDERERPHFWRYWMALPGKGSTAIFVGSWYSTPIANRVNGNVDDAELDAELHHVNGLEKQLVDDGALIIKCWLHLSKERQRKRIKKLEKNPETRWQVSKRDKKHLKLYDKFAAIAEHVLRETSTGEAPWLIVDGSDERYANITVGQHILERINSHLEQRTLITRSRRRKPVRSIITTPEMSLLDSLDLGLSLNKREYTHELALLQGRINQLAREARERKISSMLVFEGWDAAGKGGAIRRLIHAMDARQYRVIPIAAPTDEEAAHHYLWRFWRHLPREGQVTIYDRSWYGRVLVERVEGFAREDEWMRAYSEINQFEEELNNHGIEILKFWVHISKEEQLKRFKEREKISYKQFKITKEDYRNRERWDDYQRAVNDMVTRNSTEYAPWHLVEGNDKRHARIKILRCYAERLEAALKQRK